MSDSVRPHGLWPTRLLYPWDFPGTDTGVGCHSFSRGSSWPRDWPWVSWIAGNSLSSEPPGEAILLSAKNNAQCESWELSFIWGKMRSIAWKTAFQLTLRSSSKAAAGRSYMQFSWRGCVPSSSWLYKSQLHKSWVALQLPSWGMTNKVWAFLSNPPPTWLQNLHFFCRGQGTLILRCLQDWMIRWTSAKCFILSTLEKITLEIDCLRHCYWHGPNVN